MIFIKKIYVNLKRFDIRKERFGVNNIAKPRVWGSYISQKLDKGLENFKNDNSYVVFMPEAHIIPAVNELSEKSKLKIGCQSISALDTSENGNFGAFTTGRTANSMIGLGCNDVIIGHCEERRDLLALLSGNETTNKKIANKNMNEKIITATKAGMDVLYCIGETMEEQENWQDVLKAQIEEGLDLVDISKITIAYEPVWSIGPGKTPPDKDYIKKVAVFIKSLLPATKVVYGGGLKEENADILSSIDEIDGGLIALTRFSGEIGFYPDEFFKIIDIYLNS